MLCDLDQKQKNYTTKRFWSVTHICSLKSRSIGRMAKAENGTSKTTGPWENRWCFIIQNIIKTLLTLNYQIFNIITKKKEEDIRLSWGKICKHYKVSENIHITIIYIHVWKVKKYKGKDLKCCNVSYIELHQPCYTTNNIQYYLIFFNTLVSNILLWK